MAGEFERRADAVQLIGGAILGLVVLAGLLGLFGNGPLSSAALGTPGGPLRVEYDRFLHQHAPQRLRLRLGPAADDDGEARVWLASSYLEGVRVERIDPPPDRVEVGPDGQMFTFLAYGRTGSSTVVVHFIPERVGRLAARVKLPGRRGLAFSQFVYP